eukprot:12983244-Alexandrium_andersonii.AAC.1
MDVRRRARPERVLRPGVQVGLVRLADALAAMPRPDARNHAGTRGRPLQGRSSAERGHAPLCGYGWSRQ